MNLNHKSALLNALISEVDLRKDYLNGDNIETIYFGGGTPSLLSAEELNRLMEKIYRSFAVVEKPEITFEANPDDLSEEKIKELRTTPINRLSIGIQSFHDDDLQFLNRAHNSLQAESSAMMAQDAGFENITVDLIYGLPEKGRGTRDGERRNDELRSQHSSFVNRKSSLNKWNTNLEKLNRLRIPHFSAYCLTVEPKTILEKMIREKKTPGVDDAESAQHFEMLLDFAVQNGYDHYEISNFAKAERYSRHNTSYWTGKKYLGMGPSAHSYDGVSRQWNVANNALYIQSLEKGQPYFEKEVLSDNDRFNEYVMTALRTKWGVNENFLVENFGLEKLKAFEENTLNYLKDKLMVKENQRINLSRSGKMIADRIISDLFVTD